jgi:hypothetical protein
VEEEKKEGEDEKGHGCTALIEGQRQEPNVPPWRPDADADGRYRCRCRNDGATKQRSPAASGDGVRIEDWSWMEMEIGNGIIKVGRRDWEGAERSLPLSLTLLPILFEGINTEKRRRRRRRRR